MVGKLQKAALGYEEWKRTVSRLGPDFRPWLRPEQSFVPQLDRADVCASQAEVDEAHARNPNYADFGESVARLFREGGQPPRGMLTFTCTGAHLFSVYGVCKQLYILVYLQKRMSVRSEFTGICN